MQQALQRRGYDEIPQMETSPGIVTWHKLWQGDPAILNMMAAAGSADRLGKEMVVHWWKALVHDGEHILLKIFCCSIGRGHLSSDAKFANYTVPGLTNHAEELLRWSNFLLKELLHNMKTPGKGSGNTVNSFIHLAKLT